MTKYRVSYSGSDPVRLGKAGVFGPGTVAYVDEADAAEARKLAGFTVEAEGGGGVADATPQPVAPAKEASAPAQAAPAPTEKKEEKKDEKGKDKKDEKGGDKKDAAASTPPAANPDQKG